MAKATPDYKTVCNKCNKEVTVDTDGGEEGHGAPCVEPKESAAPVAPKHQDAPRR